HSDSSCWRVLLLHSVVQQPKDRLAPSRLPRDPHESRLPRPSSMPAHTNLEHLRRRYLPTDIRLLFIGESPPASGRFFYCRDSGLYRAIRDAFRILDPSITDDGFLGIFQAAGCYL